MSVLRFTHFFQELGTACPTITLSPSSISNMTVGQAQSITITSSGGTAPYTYSVTSGSLPTGLSLNGTTGAITGTPTTSQAASFTITSTDANSCTGSQAYSFSVAFDSDAQSFITAATITDSTQQSAINTLVVDLKGYGIWSKMKAIYPFVGGTASTHKWNLKDPRDLDAAFRLVFSGGATHDSNGWTPNGTNGYADTKFAITSLTRDANSTGIYCRTDVDSGADFGVYDSGINGSMQSNLKATNLWYTRNGSNTLNSTSNTDSRGFFQMTRRNSSNYVVSKNTTKTTITQSATDSFSNTDTIPLGAIKIGGSVLAYSARNYAFYYFGNTSLSDTELDNMNTLVTTFQTTLGRNV